MFIELYLQNFYNSAYEHPKKINIPPNCTIIEVLESDFNKNILFYCVSY